MKINELLNLTLETTKVKIYNASTLELICQGYALDIMNIDFWGFEIFMIIPSTNYLGHAFLDIYIDKVVDE